MAVSRFHRLLEAKVKEVIEGESIRISNGQPPDWASYRESVGYIRGLTDALRLCEDVEKDLDL